MISVSGYRMIFNLLQLEQIYNSILCNTMVLSSTIIIVSKNDREWPRTAIITDYRPTHGTARKGHKVGIIQALTVKYICISKVPFPFRVNKLCSDSTKICLDIGPALLVSKLLTICIASTTWPTTTDQIVLINMPYDLYSMF